MYIEHTKNCAFYLKSEEEEETKTFERLANCVPTEIPNKFKVPFVCHGICIYKFCVVEFG